MIQMNVSGIVLDPNTSMPIVLLKDETGKKMLPIWIGPFEASSIVFQLEGIKSTRPQTHDLILNFLSENGLKVEKVIITDLKDNTYFAKIFYHTKWKKKFIDARPSDAIALALRAKVPIYIEDRVIVSSLGIESLSRENAEEYYKDYLANLSNKDFNNNIM